MRPCEPSSYEQLDLNIWPKIVGVGGAVHGPILNYVSLVGCSRQDRGPGC